MTLTRTRNLRTGDAVWTGYRHPKIPTQRLARNTHADVAVIGAGISGALVAHALTETGLRPLIFDRRRSALRGSTAASTALLQFELDVPLIKLSSTMRRRDAEQVWKCSRAAVNELRTRAIRLRIDAHLQDRPSLYLAGNVLNATGLQREVRARQRIGLPSEYLDRKALRHHFNIDRSAAILSHGNAEADPVALAAGFLRAAIRKGARLHAPHEIADLHATRLGVTLTTRDGLEVFARKVVLCTGYEMPRIVPSQDNTIRTTWVIATGRQPDNLWPRRALIWEASDPYLYARATQDGKVICGGEDEDFSDDASRDARIVTKTAVLENKLQRLLPELDATAEFAWAGSFGSSPSSKPTIGQIPDHPNCYAVLGYGGNGITFSMLAATLLTHAVRGKRDPDAKLFAFR